MCFEITNDGSILDHDGKVIFFSIKRFVKDIGKGNCCFICGDSPSKTTFNKEHILPKWILKKYDLFSRTITLPNETGFRYDQYVVPCCQQCNTLMGEKIEQPVRNLIDQGFYAVQKHIEENGYWLFFIWLNIIFLKTHLKDKNLKLYRNSRQGSGMISDSYFWEELHHIHCIARSFYTGCHLDFNVMGSFLTLEAKIEDYYEKFDYTDLYHGRSVLLRLNDICFISILNDSCASQFRFSNSLNFQKLMSFAWSPIQLREILAHLNFINQNLKYRPKFATIFDSRQNLFRIVAVHSDKIAMDACDRSDLGAILYYCCKPFLDQFETPDIELINDQVKEGKYTFLVDSENRPFLI